MHCGRRGGEPSIAIRRVGQGEVTRESKVKSKASLTYMRTGSKDLVYTATKNIERQRTRGPTGTGPVKLAAHTFFASLAQLNFLNYLGV